MNRSSENVALLDREGGHHDNNTETLKTYERRQSGKSVKAMIGLVLLVVVALVLARMHPAPHSANLPSSAHTTGQVTGTLPR